MTPPNLSQQQTLTQTQTPTQALLETIDAVGKIRQTPVRTPLIVRHDGDGDGDESGTSQGTEIGMGSAMRKGVTGAFTHSKAMQTPLSGASRKSVRSLYDENGFLRT